MSDIVSAEVVAIMENRVREQVNRHLFFDSDLDRKKIIELTIRQEKERQMLKLTRLLDSEVSVEGEELQILMLRSLIDDVLPELESLLKRRY